MPTTQTEGAYWEPDFDLMRTLPGAAELEEWFGFSTDFHDSELSKCDIEGSSAKLLLAAFRMTSETDSAGFFVLDRHARVTLHLEDVDEVRIDGDIPTTILELGCRRLSRMGGGPGIELAWDDVCGGSGSISAGNVRFSFEPTETAS